MSRAEDRDLAGEATVREAYVERLRNDISAEEANDEMAERNAEGTYDYDDLSDEEWDDVVLAERNRDWF